MPETRCACAFHRPFRDADEEADWRQTHDIHIKIIEGFEKLAKDRAALLTKQDLADMEARLGPRIESLVTTVLRHSEEIADLQRWRDARP
jgi:hypothetical protein